MGAWGELHFLLLLGAWFGFLAMEHEKVRSFWGIMMAPLSPRNSTDYPQDVAAEIEGYGRDAAEEGHSFRLIHNLSRRSWALGVVLFCSRDSVVSQAEQAC